jgi:hypothetical protein
MTERKKDLLILSALLALMVLFFSRILFTHQIIRAPDIINEFYWGVQGIGRQPFWSQLKVNLSSAGWNPYINSGHTTGGGGISTQFLFLRNLVFWFIPAPESVAWYIVAHLFIGAAGAYCLCRLIGTSRLAAVFCAAVFALAPENASLINAGHVMKIATISFAPWAFYLLEKSFQTRRLFYFLATGVLLAYQFFHTHWQIAYYTCLAVGVYGLIRSVGILREEHAGKKEAVRLISLNLALLCFFLTTVAISLVPLADWSKDTNRGADSGANVVAAAGGGSAPAAKGGLAREEAMSWSLPPEELAAFVVPGMFGFSRQEAGANPPDIGAYYWGRMVFTQTVSYMGLLPLVLLPLPLIFRRNRYSTLALTAVVVGVLFSMGKYTPFYNFLFDHFPGINRFRVPKMIMFIPVLGLGVLGAQGLDLLLDPAVRQSRAFKRYLWGVLLLPVLLVVAYLVEKVGSGYWINMFIDLLGQPTRYQQQSEQLVFQRWGNLTRETAIAAGYAALLAAAIWAYWRGKLAVKLLPLVLFVIFLADVWRVDSKFMFLVDEPHKATAALAPEIAFLAGKGKEFRTLPMGMDPMPYANAGVPVMFTSNAVQQRRWQEFLDNFNLMSNMPDLINLRWVVVDKAQYEQTKNELAAKYQVAFSTPELVVLENRSVLPKGWLVPSAVKVDAAEQRLGAMKNGVFDPARLALVESQPPIPLAPVNAPVGPAGRVQLTRYDGDRVELDAAVKANALLVLGEKYYRGWRATVDGKPVEIYPVDHVLRGVYLTPGNHKVEFVFDPTPFKVGRSLTLGSLFFFALMLLREKVLPRLRARTAAGTRPAGSAADA